ncbi:MAG: protein kinase [Lentisphaerae bacterium]|nr:protein kinase [Lentisphaerota bacterium]
MNTKITHIDQAETLVWDRASKPPSHDSKVPDVKDEQAKDPKFLELVDNYKTLLHNRRIPYPVAYELVKELGHGRQGIIFLGTRHGARGCLTKHAIKLFDPSIYSSAEKYWTDMGRIAQQVSILQPINNRNLVSKDLYEECNGIGYMQMQAIDGVDLDFLLSSRHLGIARERSSDKEWERFCDVLFKIEGDTISFHQGFVIYIMRNVLRALSALHDKGFVHGDIKPTNVMINIQGTVIIVDFGRAVRIGERVNILLGSPLYMAPEIHRREPGTAPSDFFSLGLVALEALKGQQITKMANLDEDALLEFKKSLATDINSYLPESLLHNKEFVHVIKRFLQPEPSKRYQTAHDALLAHDGLLALREHADDEERETEYEQELELYLNKLVDPESATLNPHFATDNITALIITNDHD